MLLGGENCLHLQANHQDHRQKNILFILTIVHHLPCLCLSLLLLLSDTMCDAQQGVFETYLLPRPNNQPSKQTPYLRFDHEDSSVYATPPEVSPPISIPFKRI